MQLHAVILMSGFAEPHVRREAWLKVKANFDASGAPWFDGEMPARDRLILGDLEGAVEAYLEFLEPPLATGIYRREKFFYNEYPELYEDPRIVARLAELDREFIAIRGEVQEMLRRPEWND
jgi:hypothetical protein